MSKHLHILSRIMMVAATFVFFSSLFAALYFFIGFLGGGRSWIAILQAFALCFGLGAMLYIPAAIMFVTTKYIRQNGPSFKVGIACICIGLPLVGLSILGLGLHLPLRLLTFGAFIYGLLVVYWGGIVCWCQKRTHT